jgi:anti-sigma regulatory factor (Ser/Thr protein kinase)
MKHRLEVSFSATKQTSTFARHLLQCFLADIEIADPDLIQAFGEAVSNAWKHGCKGIAAPVIKVVVVIESGKIVIESGKIVIEIADPGSGFDPTESFRTEIVDGKQICAPGRLFMQKGCDQVAYERRGEWFCCRLVKAL